MSFNTQSSRRPVAVSSMSSLESSASAYDTVQEQASLPETSTLDSLIPSPPHTNSVDLDNETSSNVPLAVSSSLHTSGTVLAAPVPIISRPAASVPAPASVSNNNTVAEFIFQLTKMLTDDNKDVIEWSNGQINVHDPTKLASDVLHKYFRHSKFASFQRQLNYFGFRKLAGKGKMAPCSYINEEATSDLRSLLLIKRKATATPSDDKRPRKRERIESASRTDKSASVPVNPVLAGILRRNSASSPGKPPKAISVSATSAQLAIRKGIKHNFIKSHSGMPSSTSHQALARTAVGKGVRHGFSVPSSATEALSSATMIFPDLPQLSVPDLQDSLSELTNNYRNSLQNAVTTTEDTKDEENESDPSFDMYHFLRRDSSLVDLAMLVSTVEPENMGSVEPTPVNEMRTSTLSFVDFPHQDFDPSINNDESEE